jgi:glyoxylase-like metal-dependent hydrolase (beta-lactamase superfamily II)
MTAKSDDAFTSTMRVLRPAPGILGFYDGRIAGRRLWSAESNWLDDGAYELGVCSYAIVRDGEALVYDTHISLAHARFIRQTLEALGVHKFTVVLSHWHDDHIAGNGAFADCEIVAHALTREFLVRNRTALETGNPPIAPLVLPTRTFDTRLELRVGETPVVLHHADIHSQDGVVLVLPKQGILLAGDTLEDPITYVAEPERLRAHLDGLDVLNGLVFERILPNHGDEHMIEAGGYPREFLQATQRYVRKLLRCVDEPGLAAMSLDDWIAEDLASGVLQAYGPYKNVHRRNVDAVLRAASSC